MALKLCNGCERHVRESDAACPYCGSAQRAQVPAPARSSRKAMLFAAAVLTTAAVETVSGCAVYGAPVARVEPVDCEEVDCGYTSRCQAVPVSPVGQRALELPNAACTEPVYRRLVDACIRDSKATDCPSVARSRADCARCVIGPRDQDPLSDAPPAAMLSLTPLVVNTGACAAAVLGRPDCAAYLTSYEARVIGNCASCTDPDSSSACRAAQRSTSSSSEPTTEQLDCLNLRDGRRAEWEPACVGATPVETLDKTAHVLCFGQ